MSCMIGVRTIVAVFLAPLAGPALAQAREAVLVTFPRTPDSELVSDVAGNGVVMGEYVEGQTYLGSVAPGALDATRGSLPAGVTVVPVPVDQKLMTLGPLQGGDTARSVAVEIVPAVGSGDAAVAAAVADLPVTVLDSNQRHGWIVEIDPADLQALARTPMVESLYAAPASGVLK